MKKEIKIITDDETIVLTDLPGLLFLNSNEDDVQIKSNTQEVNGIDGLMVGSSTFAPFELELECVFSGQDVMDYRLFKSKLRALIYRRKPYYVWYSDMPGKKYAVLPNGSNTLMNHVIYTVKSDYVEPIHRLDQETVGLLIVAKNPLMKKILDRMLEENEIDRIYKANVHSLLPIKPQTIDMPIGKDKFHSNKRRVSPTGQTAITHIINSKMIKEDVSEVDLKLDTGRTHQIRVHLAEIGHPVIGDPLYGNSTLRQLQLNSYKIEFIHPLTQETISVSMDDEI